MADLMDKVLAMFPPMLHNFFQSGWPEPASWFNARLAFTRTAAVWSMVGHVLGLGDRHGENILVDTVTGDCLHIDFACLFDKVPSSQEHSRGLHLDSMHPCKVLALPACASTMLAGA